MFVLRLFFKILLLPVFFLLLLLKAMIVAFEDLSSVIIGAMVLLIGFGIAYCIYSHRYQEIIIFLVVGMILMVGMFAVTIIEGMCDSLIEKISEL
ncbi:hypothetical protein [Butyrivibrio sp. LC3010]|uniref:hypothetical protein n=1 Tax=Butyrivibrio sp. LC3010 TaxID=1280680 RepID=UPI00040004A3|nr:hypothetical protein [Butyrivibrio sp. LC3010]